MVLCTLDNIPTIITNTTTTMHIFNCTFAEFAKCTVKIGVGYVGPLTYQEFNVFTLADCMDICREKDIKYFVWVNPDACPQVSTLRFRVLSTWNIMWAQSFRAISFRATYMHLLFVSAQLLSPTTKGKIAASFLGKPQEMTAKVSHSLFIL